MEATFFRCQIFEGEHFLSPDVAFSYTKLLYGGENGSDRNYLVSWLNTWNLESAAISLNGCLVFHTPFFMY